MTRSITVRNPDFDVSRETPRYWYDGSPGRTHFMNALSTTFPEGEAFFVRSVLHYRDRIADRELREQVRRFAGQEGAHSREHGAHVKLLVEQGYPWIERLNQQAAREMRFYNERAPEFALAVTAALEHITAILARRALRDPRYWTGPMHPDMAPFWLWHAMEEAEHKSVAFDVLARVSGRYRVRVVAMVFATLGLLADNFVRWTYFMVRDRRILAPRAWLDTARFLWGRGGFYLAVIPDYLRWYRRDFHPWQIDDQPLIDACRARLGL